MCYDGRVQSEEQHVRIHIATGSVLKILLLLAAAALAWYLRDIALIMLTAVVIASAMEPGVRWFSRRGLPLVLSVVIMYAGVIGAFVAALYFFVPLIVQDILGFFSHLPQELQSVNHIADRVPLLPLSAIAPSLSSAAILQMLSGVLTGSSGTVVALLSAFFGGIISFGLVVVFSFYFSVQETGVDDFLVVVTPPRYHEYVIGLWKRTQDKIGRWMQGQLLLGFMVGVLLFLGLTILQVPFAFLLAILSAFFEIIPVFGQILAMIPAVAIAFGQGGTTLAILVAGLYLLVQQFEAHLIYPLVVRKIVGIPPLLVILALIIGGQLAGFIGVILSVPIATALRELISDIEKRRILAREGK